MTRVSVQENIDRINKAQNKFKTDILDINIKIEELQNEKRDIDKELLRLEGCLLTFEGLKTAGIDIITPSNEQEQKHEHEHEHEHEHKKEDNSCKEVTCERTVKKESGSPDDLSSCESQYRHIL